eukprot:2239210-Prymnesium_polylepis.1
MDSCYATRLFGRQEGPRLVRRRRRWCARAHARGRIVLGLGDAFGGMEARGSSSAFEPRVARLPADVASRLPE